MGTQSDLFQEAEDLTPYMPEVEENPVQGLHISDLIAFKKR